MKRVHINHKDVPDSVFIESYSRLKSTYKVSDEISVSRSVVNRRLSKITEVNLEDSRYQKTLESNLMELKEWQSRLYELYGYTVPDVPPQRYKNTEYLVYLDGRVFSEKLKRFICYSKINNGKYCVYRLRIYQKYVCVCLHRMIGEAYIPNPNNYPLIRHLNDDPIDIRLCNLAWGDKSKNMHDAVKNGCIPTDTGISKLSEEKVRSIRQDFKNGLSNTQIGEKYGIKSSNAWYVTSGRTWKKVVSLE